MTDDADYHRTFERFSANKLGMWPQFKQNPHGLNYRGQEAFEKEYEEMYAKRVGAFNAYQRSSKGLQPIRLMPKDGQEFWKYATDWEDSYSTLTSHWNKRVEPVVDDKLAIVGHLGVWRASEILIPKAVPGDMQLLISNEAPIFASTTNPMPSYYDTLRDRQGNPEWSYRLLTAPDGAIENAVTVDVGSGAESTMSPWEYVSIARTAVALVGTGRRYLINMVARRGTARSVAAGPTKELAERARTLTAEELKTVRGGAASGRPPLLSAEVLSKPVPQIKAGIGPKRPLTTEERSGVTEVLGVLERTRLNPKDLERIRANPTDESLWKELGIGNRRVQDLKHGPYANGGWKEIDVLVGNTGWNNQMRVLFRVRNGDLEAKILQVH